MTARRNQRAQVKVLRASVLDVRARLEAAGFKASSEEEFEDGSVEFRFTRLTSQELSLLATTIPWEAHAKRAISASSVAHLSPDELKRLMSKMSGGDKA